MPISSQRDPQTPKEAFQKKVGRRKGKGDERE